MHRELVPAVLGGLSARLLADAYPTSVLPAQVLLDSQESACSEETIRKEVVKHS